MFSFAPMIPMAILTIGFDFTARIGNETILPTGHCILSPTNLYKSLFLAYMYIAIHKICQLLVFIYTLHYFHKLYVSFGYKGQSTTDGKPVHVVTHVDHPGNSSSSESSSSDDDSSLNSHPIPHGETQDHTEYRKARDQMSKDEVRTEKKKYLGRLMISASFPEATLLSVVLWFLCFTTGLLLKPFSAGGGWRCSFACSASHHCCCVLVLQEDCCSLQGAMGGLYQPIARWPMMPVTKY